MTELPKNLTNYKRFEDLELGGDLRVRVIPVSIRKISRSSRTDGEGSQIYLKSDGNCSG